MRSDTQRIRVSLVAAGLAWALGASAALGQWAENCTGAPPAREHPAPHRSGSYYVTTEGLRYRRNWLPRGMSPAPRRIVLVCFVPTEYLLGLLQLYYIRGCPPWR